MSINLTSLTKYVDENSGIFMRQVVNVGTTLNYISRMDKVDYQKQINLFDSDLVGQNGFCGTFNATGSVTIGKAILEVCEVKLEEKWCPNKFDEYWLGQLDSFSAYKESGPAEFNELYLADKVAKSAQMIEDLAWKGSKDGNFGSGNLTLCDGLLEDLKFTSATLSTISTTYSGALTTSNALTIVDDMFDLIPSDLVDAGDLTLFMSQSNFKVLMRALRNNNYFHDYDGTKSFTWVLDNYTNTNLRVIGVRGLNGRNEMVLTPASNLFVGFNSMKEARDGEGIQFFYNIVDNDIRFRMMYKVGFKVARPQYVVIKNS